MAEVKTVELLADLSAFANIGEGMFFFLLFSFFLNQKQIEGITSRWSVCSECEPSFQITVIFLRRETGWTINKTKQTSVSECFLLNPTDSLQ